MLLRGTTLAPGSPLKETTLAQETLRGTMRLQDRGRGRLLGREAGRGTVGEAGGTTVLGLPLQGEAMMPGVEGAGEEK